MVNQEVQSLHTTALYLITSSDIEFVESAIRYFTAPRFFHSLSLILSLSIYLCISACLSRFGNGRAFFRGNFLLFFFFLESIVSSVSF